MANGPPSNLHITLNIVSNWNCFEYGKFDRYFLVIVFQPEPAELPPAVAVSTSIAASFSGQQQQISLIARRGIFTYLYYFCQNFSNKIIK